MTALKPIVNTSKVRGVKAGTYPLNKVCAHPECDRTDVTAHHIFPRSTIGNGLWFVEGVEGVKNGRPIPHVIGLCGHGTDGHHGEVELHRAWIKYEEGEFVWYDRTGEPPASEDYRPLDAIDAQWEKVGALKPQPCEPVTKKRKPKKRNPDDPPPETWTIRAPKDDPEAIERVKEKVGRLMERFTEAGHEIGPTVTLERALDFTSFNAGSEDF